MDSTQGWSDHDADEIGSTQRFSIPDELTETEAYDEADLAGSTQAFFAPSEDPETETKVDDRGEVVSPDLLYSEYPETQAFTQSNSDHQEFSNEHEDSGGLEDSSPQPADDEYSGYIAEPSEFPTTQPFTCTSLEEAQPMPMWSHASTYGDYEHTAGDQSIPHEYDALIDRKVNQGYLPLLDKSFDTSLIRTGTDGQDMHDEVVGSHHNFGENLADDADTPASPEDSESSIQPLERKLSSANVEGIVTSEFDSNIAGDVPSGIDPFLGVEEFPSFEGLMDVPSADKLAASLDELDNERGSEVDNAEDNFGRKQPRISRIASDDDDEKSEVGEIIRDIFGESDEEGEEFQGFDEKDEPMVAIDQEAVQEDLELSDKEPEEGARQSRSYVENDFDMIMEKRREEKARRRNRKRKDIDIINDSDEIIQFLIEQMREAAREDRELNEQRKPALKKRKLLPHVLLQLKKQDLQMAFIDSGVITAMTEWLSPLPDKSLPSLEIRAEFLKLLYQFPSLHQEILKSSNIGKAVMYLYKHPKETKENRQVAGKLISEWARPIFNIQSDFQSLSKEDREQRDYEHMPQSKKRRLSTDPDKRPDGTDLSAVRPGDKGHIPRARVPRPSTKDYIIRPKWNVEGEFRKKKSAQRKSTVYDKKIREFKERTKQNKAMRAVTVNISGNQMGI